MIGLAAKLARRLAAEVHERRRWTPFGDSSNIRVYYGMDLLPDADRPMSGGIVKCLDLAQRFPNTPDDPNLLYLVSSALPARRELLARAARYAGGRVVLNQNGVAYPAWAGNDWQKQNIPNARVHAAADFVIYQSAFCQRCAERFLGARRGPSQVLYNPVDTEAFSPRDGFDQGDRIPVLLVAGSHHDAYRVKIAIEALALIRKHTEARMIVAGRLVWSEWADAEARAWVREAQVEAAVEFVGAYSQAEAPELFCKADILMHLKFQDPCPRLVVEALACGVPVVYSATGGVPELVGDGAGMGIPGPEDFEQVHIPTVDAVADAVTALLAKQDQSARQARARAVTMFSLDPWVQEHRQIFTGLVSS